MTPKEAQERYEQVIKALNNLTVQKYQLEGYIQALKDLEPRPANVIDLSAGLPQAVTPEKGTNNADN